MYADGSREANDLQELSIQQRFFDNQDKGHAFEKFQLKLAVTMTVWDGLKYTDVQGTSYINILINKPPTGGVCYIDLAQDQANGGRVRSIFKKILPGSVIFTN